MPLSKKLDASVLPELKDLHLDINLSSELIKKIEYKSLEQAYNLLKNHLNKSSFQIATSESLTAGLIMSTLVRIPFGGWHKYGCFGVYDTDAKRVFNSVEVDDVYTHTCAKEMAIGILKNSNATLALAVTGNAVPFYKDIKKLGEVFIGIAGYVKNKKTNKVEIIYTTKSINSCLEEGGNTNKKISDKCNEWILSQDNGKQFAPVYATTEISATIRNFTVYQALKECNAFLEKNKKSLIVPDFINERKKQNQINTINCYHKNIPIAKYPEVGKLKQTCISANTCTYSNKCYRKGTNEYIVSKKYLFKKNLTKTKFLKKTKFLEKT